MALNVSREHFICLPIMTFLNQDLVFFSFINLWSMHLGYYVLRAPFFFSSSSHFPKQASTKYPQTLAQRTANNQVEPIRYFPGYLEWMKVPTSSDHYFEDRLHRK